MRIFSICFFDLEFFRSLINIFCDSNSNPDSKLILQLKSASYAETVGGSPELELFFDNGKTGTANRSIKITGYGLSITDHSVTGLEPVEPVFEEINWQIKSAKIVVVNSE